MTTNNRVGSHPRARRDLVLPAGIQAVAAGASPAGVSLAGVSLAGVSPAGVSLAGVRSQDAARVLLGPAGSFCLFAEG
ncbi:hypothetical protein [Streptomyces sp. NBC_01750]|uniref:hypothetical protein n=1 Tax=Streptomyces sp. NBC_01750 TaxID=2975928 RepID=UPI002DDACEF2|nr:hypothetical protein [Streptomyces sp. NBC_01750]WSD31041.1 hypothetical protein OG966_03290 [Streptomyces sp. NBC_01750]